MSTVSQHGFLLTSRWYEAEQTTELEFWFASQAGPLRVCIEQPSVCFIPLQDQERAMRLAHADGLPDAGRDGQGGAGRCYQPGNILREPATRRDYRQPA